jgi:hypothetical protein
VPEVSRRSTRGADESSARRLIDVGGQHKDRPPPCSPSPHRYRRQDLSEHQTVLARSAWAVADVLSPSSREAFRSPSKYLSVLVLPQFIHSKVVRLLFSRSLGPFFFPCPPPTLYLPSPASTHFLQHTSAERPRARAAHRFPGLDPGAL